MRRKDREITDIKEIESIINQATVCRVGLSLNEKPYVFPINFGYLDSVLYLHGAKRGKKIDIIKQNNHACFEIDIETQVILDLKESSKSTCLYKSVIGFGKAYLVENEQEKIKALDIIMQHYSGDDQYHGNYEKTLNAVQIIKIVIESMTGKSNPAPKKPSPKT